jgi:hypothetical protein
MTEIKAKQDTEKDRKDTFNRLVTFYLDENPLLMINGAKKEFEIRFGTNSRHPISKIDFDNVVKQITTSGFKSNSLKGLHMLRVIPEYVDKNTGELKTSNVRAEIHGLDLIQEYCQTNDLNKVVQNPANIMMNKISFTQKMSPKLRDGTYLKPADFTDMNFRADLKLERVYNTNSSLGNDILREWQNSKKKFRYIKRFQFSHLEYPVFIDISVLKTSKRSNRGYDYIAENTIQEADVFNNPESYEIEIEIDNKKVGPGTVYNKPENLMAVIRKCIRIILSGLQGTSYPISFTERDIVLQSYMRLLYGEKYQPRKISHKDFIGPQSNTLQMENIIEFDATTESNIKSVRSHYTVTEKADGDRRMLFIDEEGKIYLLDTTMNVIFTGSKTTNKTLFHTLLDGEHIKYNKFGNSINLYAAFDLYYVNGKSVREKAFLPEKEGDLPQNFRLPLLTEVIDQIKVLSILPENNPIWKEVKNTKGEITWMDNRTGAISKQRPILNPSCKLRIQCKKFYATSVSATIFQACSTILSDIKDGAYEYETDGLIFTPSNTGVGSDAPGKAGKLTKVVWELSYKWKPVSHNTIDFLVTVIKDKTGKDEIHYNYQEGINTQGMQNIMPYKTLRLMCGFDQEKHGYLNPFQDIIHGKLPTHEDIDNEASYRPEPFYPTNPYDPEACLCNIFLHDTGNGLYMTTEESMKKIGIDENGVIQEEREKEKVEEGNFSELESRKFGDIFEEFMIVEFRYDKTAEPGWRWKPIRVRYDKTNELLRGIPNYGNAFHVANNNWRSIHNEITPEMLKTGENIPDRSIDGDTYYNKTNGEKFTEAMRNFHNLFVKQKLIRAVSNKNDIMIDYAVGKGGDLSKWIHSHLGFVFGIDLSRDNIHNPKNGACARYLTACKEYKKLPYALFVNGNSGFNIRDTSAFPGDKNSKDKMIANAIFGKGPKDAIILGKGVYERYGEAEQGFHISSCQFALHYFFETPRLLHGFLRNLAECTRLQGYFIGTCYDGKTIFNLLSKKRIDESVVFIQNKRKICEIKKMYEETGFSDDETSVGYTISVYQDSINNYIREYLVNFQYFIELMEHYGFTLITKEEAHNFALPNGSGLFSELFASMQNDIKQGGGKTRAYYGKAVFMSESEKSISFMNRYFVFRKVRTVNAEKIGKLLLKKTTFDEEEENEKEELNKQLAIIDKEQDEKPVNKRIRKINKRITLQPMEKPSDNIIFEIEDNEEKEKKKRGPYKKKPKKEDVKEEK